MRMRDIAMSCVKYLFPLLRKTERQYLCGIIQWGRTPQEAENGYILKTKKADFSNNAWS